MDPRHEEEVQYASNVIPSAPGENLSFIIKLFLCNLILAYYHKVGKVGTRNQIGTDERSKKLQSFRKSFLIKKVLRRDNWAEGNFSPKKVLVFVLFGHIFVKHR